MDDTIHKYVCNVEDLGKFLDKDLTRQFQSAFYDFDENGIGHPKKDSWRMFYQGMNPMRFFSRYGIDFNHPTVGIAVALDMIKIEDDTVSNDTVYTFDQVGKLSPLELDRIVLHRNFRVNLDIPADEVVDVVYNNQKIEKKKPIETHYQGVKLSPNVLEFISSVFENGFNQDTYVPFTNGQDILTEVALIPNTHPDFPPIISRAYYDRKWKEYLNLLKQYGIYNISSFSLVDANNGKNHTGEFLIKAMKKGTDGKFKYIVFRMNNDGQFIGTDGIPDITTYETDGIDILFLHEQDFGVELDSRDDVNEWSPVEGDVKMPISTTSSHTSVFRQRIPDYELRDVINYSQFKQRLEGMELYLKYIEKDIWMKEVQCSECFIQSTFAIQKLLSQFSENQEYISKLTQIYGLFSQFDSCTEKLVLLNGIVTGKQELLEKLTKQYNEISATDKKIGQRIELGAKIKSLKLELTKNMKVQISELTQTRDSIQQQITNLVQELNQLGEKEEWSDEFKNEFISELNKNLDEQMDILEKRTNEIQTLLEVKKNEIQQKYFNEEPKSFEEFSRQIDGIEQFDIDATQLNKLTRDTELWRGYMFNLGYELNQLNKMKVSCEDATIKVRRLLHNFKQKVQETREKVWTDQNTMRDDIDLESLNVPGMLDIIHLYDWYARNPDDLTYREAGFESLTKFQVMKKRYREISLDLRKQYSILLSKKKFSLEMVLQSIRDKELSAGYLKYDDKYGVDGKVDTEKSWTISDVSKTQFNRVNAFIQADKSLIEISKREQRSLVDSDFNKIHEFAIRLLIDSGLIEHEQELKNCWQKIKQKCECDILSEVESIKQLRLILLNLTDTLNKKKDIINPVIEKIASCKNQISKLSMENLNIVNDCARIKNKKQKKQLLRCKLDNESTILELNSTIEQVTRENKFDLASIDRMRDAVDKAQSKYDNKVKEFKQTIGLNQDTIDNLVIGIYNKYQDEILKNEVN